MDSDTPPALLEETLRIQRWADWVAGNAASGGRGAGRWAAGAAVHAKDGGVLPGPAEHQPVGHPDCACPEAPQSHQPRAQYADPGELAPRHTAHAGECPPALFLCLFHLWHHRRAALGGPAAQSLLPRGELHH
ncbi:X-Linked Retinitis Pigmentosa Gtpase Regulator-Interacting Protein 1, partial [Manis pentadactyla]